MATYYDVTLQKNVPHGTDFLNKPCSIIFTYSNGSHSDTYSGTAFAWTAATVVRITSNFMNIEAAWAGADGGTLTLTTANGAMNCKVTNFKKVP